MMTVFLGKIILGLLKSTLRTDYLAKTTINIRLTRGLLKKERSSYQLHLQHRALLSAGLTSWSLNMRLKMKNLT